MRNLLLYGTIYGYTEQCAKELTTKLEGQTDCINIKEAKTIDINKYDNVIIGSPVYMGQINKSMKDFINTHGEKLKSKRLGLFLCCGFAQKAQEQLKNNIPQDLFDSAIAKECFGGILDESKMRFVHKLITKMVKKAEEKEGKNNEARPLPENIEKFARAINEA